MSELAEFTKKWCHDDYSPEAVNQDQLDAAELQLKVHFPLDYRRQILEVGLPSPTLALLSAIADRDIYLHDLSGLYQPEEIVSFAKSWREIGMPDYLIAFGYDSGGSQFCFDERELRSGRVAQSTIYHWDHDFDETEKVGDSFAAWIASYLGDWSDGIGAADF